MLSRCDKIDSLMFICISLLRTVYFCLRYVRYYHEMDRLYLFIFIWVLLWIGQSMYIIAKKPFLWIIVTYSLFFVFDMCTITVTKGTEFILMWNPAAKWTVCPWILCFVHSQNVVWLCVGILSYPWDLTRT